ncbi:MAG TPA: hypothetical protein VGR57_02680 [Ktedonobacterales bacterium]|nr:hypothetical protein [Ktedonobacterales bacterium]
MAHDDGAIAVHLEVGKTRNIALARDWPGWARGGRDEAAALRALVAYGPRYARVLQATPLTFHAPADIAALAVVERVEGNATTDFGAPAIALASDSRPADPTELERWQTVMRACWRAFDLAVAAAAGKTLRKGPRGGGREVPKITDHVRDSESAYLASLGGAFKPGAAVEPDQAQAQLRAAILATLAAAVRGEVPALGPRGKVRWAPRYFVRRLAWHCLDHAWEIEDKIE